MARVACRAGCGTVLERTRVHKAGALCNACRMKAKKRGRKAAANKALSRPQNPSRRVCDVEGCQRPHDARGLCNHHYKAHRRDGLIAYADDPYALAWEKAQGSRAA